MPGGNFMRYFHVCKKGTLRASVQFGGAVARIHGGDTNAAQILPGTVQCGCFRGRKIVVRRKKELKRHVGWLCKWSSWMCALVPNSVSQNMISVMLWTVFAGEPQIFRCFVYLCSDLRSPFKGTLLQRSNVSSLHLGNPPRFCRYAQLNLHFCHALESDIGC